MSLPRISIVTPSFNQGAYLDETIRSVLDQNYPNLEYLVIDGGSTDNSVEIIRKYHEKIAFWVSEKDQGQTHALNKGVARCTGDVFGYINSDDLLMPGSLDRVAREWQAGNRWIVGWSKYLEIGGGDWPYAVRPTRRPVDWFLHDPIPQQSSFWAMKFFQQIGNFRQDMHYAFDYEYFLRLRFVAKVEPAIIRQCLGAFRLHEDSKTVSTKASFGPENAMIRREYSQYLSLGQKYLWWKELRRDEAIEHWDQVWKSLKMNDRAAARKHAWQGFGKQPLSFTAWWMVYCSITK